MKFLPLPREANPFLGMRGIRVSLDQPQLLRTQLRAILAAAPAAKTCVLFPMIATLDEFRAAAAILREELRGTQNVVKTGVMIEVPSAAVLAEALAREVDFFSIGTNDLIQYTLAMDRGHARLARSADGLNPAVLKMIQLAVDGAHAHGKPVAVCGGLAAELPAVPLLVGLGVDELSVPPKAVPQVKALVRTLVLADCRKLAAQALKKGTAAEVRLLLFPS